LGNSGSGYIVIDYSSLSEENKIVVEFMIGKGLITRGEGLWSDEVIIEGPIDETTTVEGFSENMLKLASFFRQQEMLYGFFTEEIIKKHAIDNIDLYIDILIEEMEKGLIEEEPNGEVEITSNGKRISLKTLIKMYVELCTNYYYDEKNNRYWRCKELYDKAQSTTLKGENARKIDGITK